LNNLDFNKDNVLVYGKDGSSKSSFVQDIYYNRFSEEKEVYFFDEFFNSVEYKPENPSMGGIIKMRNNSIDGLKTILTSIVVGGRKGLTLIVDFSFNVLVESGCLEMLKDLTKSNNDCNLIITCNDFEELKDFDYDYILRVDN
jgi:hypothetical protein